MKKIEKIKENIDKKTGPVAKIVVPIIAAVIVVAAAVAYICMKIADEVKYNEKWKDYDECGMH